MARPVDGNQRTRPFGANPAPDGTPFYSARFASGLDHLGETIEEAVVALEKGGWVEEGQTFYARLCLEEALVNAVMHGNENDPTREVRLEMVDEGDKCCIRVYDQGAGFSIEDVRTPTLSEPNGRGVCLIKYCMESVGYDTGRNCLEMRMRRKGLCGGCHGNE